MRRQVHFRTVSFPASNHSMWACSRTRARGTQEHRTQSRSQAWRVGLAFLRCCLPRLFFVSLSSETPIGAWCFLPVQSASNHGVRHVSRSDCACIRTSACNADICYGACCISQHDFAYIASCLMHTQKQVCTHAQGFRNILS